VDRVFLDANVLFSAAYRTDSGLRALWEREDAVLITSTYAVEEASRNLSAIRPERLSDLNALVSRTEVVAMPAPSLAFPESIELKEKDRPILLAAILANATHLLTGDKGDFGGLFGTKVGNVLILTPSEYLRPRSR
jgi:predicted nucleic acid-binding protein